MSLNDWQPVPLVATGDLWTAAEHNTYIRNNQQVLHDGLAAGHGSGSNADMVDGRHAAAGAWPGMVWSDRLVVDVPPGTEGWYTVARAEGGKAAGRLWMIESGDSYTNTTVMEAVSGWDEPRIAIGGTSRFGYRGVYAARLVVDTPSSGVPVTYLQAYLQAPDDGKARSVMVYLETPTAGEYAWALDTTPPPSGSSVAHVVVTQNGSWRLARAFAGSGVTGWQTAAQTAALFPDAPKWMTDGDASNGNGSSDSPIYTGASSDPNLILDGVAIWLRATSSSGGANRRIDVSADGSTWETVGYASRDGTTAVRIDVTFAARSVRYVRLVQAGLSDEVVEMRVRRAAAIAVTGVPVGCVVVADDANGQLASARNNTWQEQRVTVLDVDASQVARLRVSRPDGATPWLEYPTWAIDGGALTNGDVLTLYSEA